MALVRTLVSATAILAFASAPSLAFDGVVASIKPIHSLVAGVMRGAGSPHLLVRGAASPHTYSLRPSDAKALESARLIFWVGPQLEVALDGALDTLGAGARIVALGETHDLTRLKLREGGAFEAHDHEDSEHAAADGGHHDDEHDHALGGHDMHLWLDPENAGAMVRAIEAELAAADPGNAALYGENADDLLIRLETLTNEIVAELEPVKDRPFVVFHDAYHYFEDRFGLRAAGSITVSPDVMPGARRLAEIRERIMETKAACAFAEPQFEPSLIEVATEGTGARTGVLDPLGSALADGPDLYFELMRGMASSFSACLSEPG